MKKTAQETYWDNSSFIHLDCIYFGNLTGWEESLFSRIDILTNTEILYSQPKENNMRKQVAAFLFAFIITAIVVLSMLVVGVNAANNPNGVTASNSPTAPAASASTSTDSAQAQIAQLQAELAQYQARDQQYQAALNSDNQQLSQAAQEMQMIQQLLIYLQNRGLIQINNQGQITVPGN
jgi:uncharacterized protein YpmS